MNDADNSRETALRILASRDHTAAELRRKLLRKRFPEEIIDKTLSTLIEKGYLDDRRFAERWVQSAHETGRSFGPRLRRELLQRGVDPDTTSDVINELSAGESESEALQLLVRRKFPEFNPRDADERVKRKVFGFLQRRGFSLSAILSWFKHPVAEE